MVGVVLFGLPCRTEKPMCWFPRPSCVLCTIISMNVVKFQTKRKPRFSGPVVLLLTGSSKKKSNLRLYVIISKLGQVTMPRQFCLIQGFHGLFIYSEGGGFWRHTPNTNNPSHNHQSGIRTNNCMNVQECMFNTACLVSSPSNWQTHCKHENMKNHAKPCGSKFGIWMEQCSICLGDFF